MKIHNYSDKIIKSREWYDPGLRNETDIILSLIDIKSGRVLDVGCGTGRISISLAKKGFKVDAVDIEPKVIDIAKELAREADVEVDFSVSDFTQKTDFAGKELYDLIVCSEVLEHVENYRDIIRNMYNGLKKDGVLVITVPHDPGQYSILDSYAEHLRRFTISQLKEDLKAFQIIDCFTIGFPFMRMMVWLRVFILNIFRKEPSPEKLWVNVLLRKACSFLAYKLTKIDNFFTRFSKGTNIICKVRKQEKLMKITFLEPPQVGDKIPERFAGCSYELYHFPDLANFYIMANLQKAGFEVGYIDFILAHYSDDEFYNKLIQDDSDFYIIHSVILSKKTDLFTIKRMREIKKDAMIIFHGPEPTRVPEEYLFDEKIVVFRGEPEVNILNYLKKGKETGMSYLRNGVFRHIEPSEELVDLDNLPFPLRDHKSLKPYIKNYFNPKFTQKPYTTMMTSRGCSFKCLFCVPISINFARELEYRRYFNKKPPVSIASAERVINEFKEIKKQGFKSVMIVDDQFLWNKDRTFKICEGIKDLGIEWGCLSRADFLTDEEIVKALASSGCHSIDIGIESLSQKTLDYIRKDLAVDTIYLALENLKKYKINPKLNIMFGTCPEETSQNIRNMIERLKKLYTGEVMFSLATPFKGTEFYTFCKECGYLIDESDEIDPFKKSIVSYPSLTKKELEDLQRYAYRSYYSRPSYIWHRIKSYTKLNDLVRDVRLAINLLR